MTKIGILSDTHGLLRPEVLECLQGCEHIFHGGDINKQSILDELYQTVSPDHSALKDHPEILLHIFEGGKYGVYHFKGYPRYLFMVYQEIFCRWLAKTGNRLERNKPIFDIYRKDEALEIVSEHIDVFIQKYFTKG